MGSFSISETESLQVVGASIYEFAEKNGIVNYKTYKVRFSGSNTAITGARTGTAMGIIEMQSTVDMLLPNDIYIPEVAVLTVGDLRRLLPKINMNMPIRADIEEEFREGLSGYLNQ